MSTYFEGGAVVVSVNVTGGGEEGVKKGHIFSVDIYGRALRR